MLYICLQKVFVLAFGCTAVQLNTRCSKRSNKESSNAETLLKTLKPSSGSTEMSVFRILIKFSSFPGVPLLFAVFKCFF